MPKLPDSWFVLIEAAAVAGAEPVHTPMTRALVEYAGRELMFAVAQQAGLTGGSIPFRNGDLKIGVEWSPAMQARRRRMNDQSDVDDAAE